MADKIMIVDDSLLIRKIANQIFSKQGIETVEAADGREALKLLERTHKDIVLIITDWNMPHMDGFQLLQQIKSNKGLCHIPIIIVTTETDKEKINKALLAGAADYIIKPFNAQELLSVANKHIQLK